MRVWYRAWHDHARAGLGRWCIGADVSPTALLVSRRAMRRAVLLGDRRLTGAAATVLSAATLRRRPALQRRSLRQQRAGNGCRGCPPSSGACSAGFRGRSSSYVTARKAGQKASTGCEGKSQGRGGVKIGPDVSGDQAWLTEIMAPLLEQPCRAWSRHLSSAQASWYSPCSPASTGCCPRSMPRRWSGRARHRSAPAPGTR